MLSTLLTLFRARSVLAGEGKETSHAAPRTGKTTRGRTRIRQCQERPCLQEQRINDPFSSKPEKAKHEELLDGYVAKAWRAKRHQMGAPVDGGAPAPKVGYSADETLSIASIA